MRLKQTRFIIALTLVVGVAFGIYLGNNGIEDLSLVGEASAAGGTVTGPNEVAPDRYVYYPGTEALAEDEIRILHAAPACPTNAWRRHQPASCSSWVMAINSSSTLARDRCATSRHL